MTVHSARRRLPAGVAALVTVVAATLAGTGSPALTSPALPYHWSAPVVRQGCFPR